MSLLTLEFRSTSEVDTYQTSVHRTILTLHWQQTKLTTGLEVLICIYFANSFEHRNLGRLMQQIHPQDIGTIRGLITCFNLAHWKTCFQLQWSILCLFNMHTCMDYVVPKCGLSTTNNNIVPNSPGGLTAVRYADALLCTDVFSWNLIYSEKWWGCWCALMRINVYSCVLIWADVYWCADACWCILTCNDAYWCVLMCMEMYWCALMCTDDNWRVPVCALVCAELSW